MINESLRNRLSDDAETLQQQHKDSSATEILQAAHDYFGERFALVSSFGAESAVMLHLAAQISPDIPVLFLDTGKLFGETRRYRAALADKLGLTNMVTLAPDGKQVAAEDPKGNLWLRDNNRCCFIRKVLPLNLNLAGYDAWATGRKRYHSSERAALDHFEYADGRIKVNPLAGWTSEDVKAYMQKHDLPEHPLLADGFSSIGCMPCTDRTGREEDGRAGRWRGMNKSECGIHLSLAQNIRIAHKSGAKD